MADMIEFDYQKHVLAKMRLGSNKPIWTLHAQYIGWLESNLDNDQYEWKFRNKQGQKSIKDIVPKAILFYEEQDLVAFRLANGL